MAPSIHQKLCLLPSPGSKHVLDHEGCKCRPISVKGNLNIETTIVNSECAVAYVTVYSRFSKFYVIIFAFSLECFSSQNTHP